MIGLCTTPISVGGYGVSFASLDLASVSSMSLNIDGEFASMLTYGAAG